MDTYLWKISLGKKVRSDRLKQGRTGKTGTTKGGIQNKAEKQATMVKRADSVLPGLIHEGSA